MSKKNRYKGNNKALCIALLLLLLILAILTAIFLITSEREEETPSVIPEDTMQNTVADTQASTEEPTSDMPNPIVLSEELQILTVSGYSGMYVEDGSNEIVSDVMMVIVENTSLQDLQLARFRLEYSDFTASFEITNLPAGEKLVALERNRHTNVAEKHLSAKIDAMVFFPEPMDLHEDSFRISGSDGVLRVENISGSDISGDIMIFYKNSAQDLLNGGITYRIVVRDGLAAGESKQIISGHYSPENSRIISVVYGG